MINSVFSIQEHYRKKQKRSHLDLRILDPNKNILISFAIPKFKLPEKGDRLLAIKTEDHNIDYLDFEGTLKNGDKVSLLDKGKCKIITLKKHIITIKLNGKKIKEVYTIIKIINGDNWIIFKQ